MYAKCHKKLYFQRLTLGILIAIAVVLITQCMSTVSRQNGLLVYGLDKSVGAIKPGDSFNRSITFCNTTLHPVNIKVVQACSCATTQDAGQRVAPLSTKVINLPYHIVSRDKGKFTTKAIFDCTFFDGKEVQYMVASRYTMM